MSIRPGVYKYASDGETELTVPYYGCSESFNFNEDGNILDKEVSTSIIDYNPEVLELTDYKLFSNILSIVGSNLNNLSNAILECYNLNTLDEEGFYQLSSLLGIKYPLDYDINKLKLIIKNYGTIRRIRGTEDSIKMLFKLIDRTESEYYEDDSDDTEITKVAFGEYEIRNTRITSVAFAEYLLGLVVRTGIKYTIITPNVSKIKLRSIRTMTPGNGVIITPTYSGDTMTIDINISMGDPGEEGEVGEIGKIGPVGNQGQPGDNAPTITNLTINSLQNYNSIENAFLNMSDGNQIPITLIKE